jgi:hypothetical protein
MSYEEDIKREKDAYRSLSEATDALFDELEPHLSILWRLGDGYGGHIFETVKDVFYQRQGLTGGSGGDSGCRGRKKISASTRRAVFERDAYRCVKCESFIELQIDHVFPHSKGGSDDISNLQTLCRICNTIKKDRIEVVE